MTTRFFFPVFAATLSSVHTLAACECSEPSQLEAFEHAGAVFYGTLVNAFHPYENGVVEYTFRAVETWKGPSGPLIKVAGLEHQPLCADYSLKPGNKYLLYVYPLYVYPPAKPTGAYA